MSLEAFKPRQITLNQLNTDFCLLSFIEVIKNEKQYRSN